MKANEIRDMSVEEQQGKLIDLKQTLFNLRFQLEIGQLENPRKIEETKRDIARIKTIIRESDLS
ncbi:MAG: 50S ribosomal protein L29 [Thermodesulfobacteriota bacterium]|nr:50S ribosomal protein L29 [Thermodesulfobacteriota bacterium]